MKRRVGIWLVVLAGFGAPPARAGSIVDLASLTSDNGYDSFGGIISDSAGNLYGVAALGGAHGDGAVWELPAATHAIITLASFDGTNGVAPNSGLLIDADGNLYGTTYGRGTRTGFTNPGTIYEIAHGSHTITTLATFTDTTGRNPAAGLVMDGSGSLYGTTEFGGPSGYGTIFALRQGATSPVTLSFFSNAMGYNCQGRLLLDSAGTLYGTVGAGGMHNAGVIFALPRGDASFQTLASFQGGANGRAPQGGLTMDAHGNLFGTTTDTGQTGNGTVFEVVNGTGAVTTLASFDGTNGSVPNWQEPLLDARGDLFGTAEYSTPGNGTVWELASASASLQVLARFGGANGDAPAGELVMDRAGHLYGSTLGGGANNNGVVFELDVPLPLPGDVNSDGSVNFTDLLLLAQTYGRPGTWAQGDLNADGTINFADLLLLAQNYGQSAPATAPVPEPATVLAPAAITILICRGRRATSLS